MPTALGAEFHATHLKLPRKMPYRDFEAECRTVGRMGKSHKWWGVDLIRYGEREYGERAYQALDELAYTERERSLLGRIGDAFPPERRHSVSFEHHRVVLSLTPAQQETWLGKAEQEQWSRAKLRKALQEAGLVARRIRVPGKADDLWARVRRALDLLKAARDRMAGQPWSPEEVKALVDGLEGVLFKEEATA